MSANSWSWQNWFWWHWKYGIWNNHREIWFPRGYHWKLSGTKARFYLGLLVWIQFASALSTALMVFFWNQFMVLLLAYVAGGLSAFSCTDLPRWRALPYPYQVWWDCEMEPLWLTQLRLWHCLSWTPGWSKELPSGDLWVKIQSLLILYFHFVLVRLLVGFKIC